METQISLLLVEDDVRLANLISDYLQQYNFTISVESDGDKALERIMNSSFNFIILDLMLPGLDGLSICKKARNHFKGPILILTAKEDDMDQVVGLEIGADDYVKKPVEPRVLLARIRALLRRYNTPNTSTPELSFGTLRISRESNQVFLNDQSIELTTNEFDLLYLLASNKGTILSRESIYSQLKGINYDGLDRSVDMLISRIRKKLKDDPKKPYRIKTVWAKGYLFVKDAWE